MSYLFTFLFLGVATYGCLVMVQGQKKAKTTMTKATKWSLRQGGRGLRWLVRETLTSAVEVGRFLWAMLRTGRSPRP